MGNSLLLISVLWLLVACSHNPPEQKPTSPLPLAVPPSADDSKLGSMLEPIPESIPESSLSSKNTKFIYSVSYGSDVAAVIRNRTRQLLARTYGPPVSGCAEGSQLDLQFGSTAAARFLIPDSQIVSLKNESFALRARRQGDCLTIAVRGKASAHPAPGSANLGTAYGIYETLQDIGFRFHHPLKPEPPRKKTPELSELESLDRAESPHWPVRSIHLHTQHPLELTNLLNGWGMKGPKDEKSWREMLTYWPLALEWMLAHKQNEVEWMPLWTPGFDDFNQSDMRKRRFLELNKMANAWGLHAAADAPITFTQQNGWTLLRNYEQRAKSPDRQALNRREIETNLQWLLDAGFTSIGGELGKGEFKSTPPRETLQWLNDIGSYLEARKVPARFKVHISKGQYSEEFIDPVSGKKPMNFNFLPFYAHPNIGVLPHTVQIYSLDDPAPTYGRTQATFGEIFSFLKKAAIDKSQGRKREVVFYPETSYWVSYDIDVPLFLPVYAYRRVHDLLLIAQDEIRGEMGKAGTRIDGQMIFSSGWDWGYWLNDLIAAEAAWNPQVKSANSSEAFRTLLSDALRLGKNSRLIDEIVKSSIAQHELLVLGKLEGRHPPLIEKRTGIAYLSGMETWDEYGFFFNNQAGGKLQNFAAGLVPITQPNRFVAHRINRKIPSDLFYMNTEKYVAELRPLLLEMKNQFRQDAAALKTAIEQELGAASGWLAEDVTAASEITALRARFVADLYDFHTKQIEPKNLDEVLRKTLAAAEKIAKARHARSTLAKSHRPLIHRWAGPDWQNPTSYRFGYLWTADTLFYWWRDYHKVTKAKARAGCFMNIMLLSDLVPGDPTPQRLEKILTLAGEMSGRFEGCAKIPDQEPDVQRGW